MSIIIPVRDAAGLPPMLRTLPPADEVIVVTAGPAPDAAVRAACPGALIVHQTRSGLGNALACGFAASTGDVVVTLDGDGATDPGELPRYVDALRAGADVAFGSRYREDGRDLTAGRFRRRLNLMLAWLLNVLYGARRTDPGFGYTAFRRAALDRLALPDPSAPTPQWGDGSEIEAVIAVRAAARGLAVAEVPGVAYPRMRRSSRAGRSTVRQWVRALAGEFRGRVARPPRHSATVIALPPPSAAPVEGADRTPDPYPRAEPIWGPPPRHPKFDELWLADIPAPLDRPMGMPRATPPPASGPAPGRPVVGPVVGSVPAPRTGEAGSRTGDPGTDAEDGAARRREERTADNRREVGARRRHLEGYRQRPDLRVINGEGSGGGRSRGGRLRAVPPRESTTGSLPRPQ